MRVLFGLLLLACVGFFVVMQWGDALTGTGKNGQAMADLHADKIKLLDVPVAKSALIPPLSPASAAVAASAPLNVAVATPAAVAPVIAAAVATQPAAAPVQAPSERRPAPPPVNAVKPPSMVPNLMLKPAPLPPPKPTPVARPEPLPVAPQKNAALSCMEWGEFSGTDLKQATQSLATLKLGNQLSQRTVEYTNGYWIYIPPQKNNAALNKKIAQLKAAGVDEYFLVQMPSHKVSAISLGVFKNKDAAKKFLAVVKKKGLSDAKLGPRKSKLKFTVFVLKQIDEDTVSQLRKLKKEFSNSELRSVLCK